MRHIIIISLLSMMMTLKIASAMENKALDEFMKFNDCKAQRSQCKDQKSKKLFSLKALEHLLRAAQLRSPQAMEYFLSMDEIKLLIHSIDIRQITSTNKYMMDSLRGLLNKLLNEKNSFAALVVIHFFGEDEWEYLLNSDNNPVFLMQQGLIYEKSNNLPEAMAWLERSGAQGYLPALRQRALILMKQKETQEAIAIYRTLARQNDSLANNVLGAILRTYPQFEEYQGEHLDWLTKAGDSDRLESKCVLADIYIVEGKFLEAENILREAKQILAKLDVHKMDYQFAVGGLIEYLNGRLKNQIKASEFDPQIIDQFSDGEEEIAVWNINKNLRSLNNCQDRFARFLAELEELQNSMDAKENFVSRKSNTRGRLRKNLRKHKKSVDEPQTLENNDIVNSNEPIIKDAINSVPNEDIEKQKSMEVLQPLYEEKEDIQENYLDYQNQFSKIDQPPSRKEPSLEEIDEQKFRANVAARLAKEKDVIKKLLSNQNINNSELRSILNKLGVKKPDNVRGSHNKLQVSLDAHHHAHATFIRPHRRTNCNANQNQLRKIFEKFGISSVDQLWPH